MEQVCGKFCIFVPKIKNIMPTNNALECTAEVVIVSAFEDKKKFRKFSEDIAWESEVWIAEDPDHMIHFNGIKFLDIHKNA